MAEKKRKLSLKNLATLPVYFDYMFCAFKTKSTSQARIKLEIFVNFRLEPGPSPNLTRKARPDLQL